MDNDLLKPRKILEESRGDGMIWVGGLILVQTISHTVCFLTIEFLPEQIRVAKAPAFNAIFWINLPFVLACFISYAVLALWWGVVVYFMTSTPESSRLSGPLARWDWSRGVEAFLRGTSQDPLFNIGSGIIAGVVLIGLALALGLTGFLLPFAGAPPAPWLLLVAYWLSPVACILGLRGYTIALLEPSPMSELPTSEQYPYADWNDTLLPFVQRLHLLLAIPAIVLVVGLASDNRMWLMFSFLGLALMSLPMLFLALGVRSHIVGKEKPVVTAEQTSGTSHSSSEPNSSQTNWGWAVLVVVLIAAYSSNPDEAHFKRWIVDETGRKTEGLERLATETLSQVTVDTLLRIERTSYGFLSIVSVRVHLSDGKTYFLGAFGTWWNLGSLDEKK